MPAEVACFDENSLIEIAQGGATAEGLLSAEQHLAGCDRCARAFAAVARVVAAGGPVSAADTTARASGRDSPRPLLAEGTVLKDRYRILRYIDWGGMGQVYEAAHTRLAGRYALKVLSLDLGGGPALLERFRREAELTSGLRHPNIVEAFDFDETPDGRPFLVMEFIEGRHLAEIIHSEGPLPLSRVIELVAPIVSALSAIHRQQVVHRDLKPKNIMLTSRSEDGSEDGTEIVKVLDFGLSKRWGPRSAEALSVSVDRALLGTPLYMAPEQARGELNAVGPATDQFALAAIVYEMLTRQAPFAADTVHAILYRIVSVEPTPLRTLVPSLPAGVERAIMRALSKDPAQRFASVRDFLDALREPADSAPGVAAEVTGQAMPRPTTRRRWVVPLLVLVTSAVIVAAAATFKRWRPWLGVVNSSTVGTISGADARHHVQVGADAAAATPAAGAAGPRDAAVPNSGSATVTVERKVRRSHDPRDPRAAATKRAAEKPGELPLASPAPDDGSPPASDPEPQPGVHLLR